MRLPHVKGQGFARGGAHRRRMLATVATVFVGVIGAIAPAAARWQQPGPSAPGLDGDLPMHVARMYPGVTPDTAWKVLLQTLSASGLKTERKQDKTGVAVTQWKSTPTFRFQYHVLIPPHVKPARVYVGSIAEDAAARMYNHEGVGNELFRAMEAQLGSPGRGIPADTGRRMALSLGLEPNRDQDDCLRRIAEGRLDTTAKMEQPSIISAPELPSRYGQRRGVLVQVTGAIGEDGYFQPTDVTGEESSVKTLRSLALSMASLTRYRPARVDGCPVPVTNAGFSITYWQ